MKEIPLTQGKVTFVDDDIYEWVSLQVWYYGNNGYATRDHKQNKQRISILLHRLIMNAPEDKEVDHIDGNTLNNNKNNLRWVTITENSMNAKISNTNTSGVKGVCFNKNNNKWIARININGIRVHLGYFETLEGAKQARQIRANEAFGVFTNACEKM